MNDLLYMDTDYFIKKGYSHRLNGCYFDDEFYMTQNDIVNQPDVYLLAKFLAERFGCTHIIDIGCKAGNKLDALYSKFHLIGAGHGRDLLHCKAHYPLGHWIEWNLENNGIIPITTNILRDSIVICANVLECIRKPQYLVDSIAYFSEYAHAILISSTERDLTSGISHFGPPENSCHVREWNLKEVKQYITAKGLNIAFSGLTVNNSVALEKKNSLVIVGNNYGSDLIEPPDNFRVVALMASYNEEDIIENSISNLIEQGVDVYLIDNWSSDKTRERVRHLLGHGLIAIEKYPNSGPSEYYNWREILARKEELARNISADWFIHHDVDEIRESPWVGLKLRDAIYRVDKLGFNAIDHTVINFKPINNIFRTGDNLVNSFPYFEFGNNPGHFIQIKAWKNQCQIISLQDSGGHDVKFEGRRIYPYKFLLRHYPVRSQVHGNRKIFKERRDRYNPKEKAIGWHCHNDHLRPGYNFLGREKELHYFDEYFYEHYFVERISGIGIKRTYSA
jgi:hypothetical protein